MKENDIDKLLLRQQLDEERRKARFHSRWLKKHFPDVFEEMQKASEENDRKYIMAQVSQLNERFKLK